MGKIIKFRIHTSTLQSVLGRIEGTLRFSSNSEDSSYSRILHGIKLISNTLYSKLKGNIDYQFATQDKFYFTLLHLAAECGYSEVVQVLLDKNANANALDWRDNTPLHLAAQNNHSEIVDKLLDKNANVEAVNSDGNTARELAAQNNHLEVVKKLIRREVELGSNEDEMEEDHFMKEVLLRNNKDGVEEDIEQNQEISREEVYGEEISHNTFSDNNQARSGEQATEIYGKLNVVKFDSDDSGNSREWAGMDQINLYVNQAINNDENKLANYIGPTNFGFDSKENTQDVAKHICKRVYENGNVLNDFYNTEKPLDKPFIIVSNTDTVLAENPTDASREGGSHWISWVLLPKKYTSLSGKEVNNDKYQAFFFDSLGTRSFPGELKELLTKGGQITEVSDTGRYNIKLLPLCAKEEIDFRNLNDLTGHQMNGSDCGWWAAYYALMTVYTGGVEFLEPLKGRKLSAMPLRNIMNIEENTPLDQVGRQHVDNNYHSEETLLKNNDEDEMGEDQPENDEYEMEETEYKLAPTINNEEVMEEDQLENNEGEMDEIEYASAPVIKNEYKVEEDQSNDILLEYSNEDDLGPEVPRPLDAAELNRDEVSTWEKPEIRSATEHGTPTRFDGQVILQLEDDPVVMEAAARLAAKHPESSVVVQLDSQGNYQEVYGNLGVVLEGKENLRWQVVGHGSNDTTGKTLGGYSATALAEKITDLIIMLDTDYAVNSTPKYISLVGCSLIDNVEMDYARKFALSLDEQGTCADIAARSVRVAVSNGGKKLTEDSAGNWNHKISEDKVIYAWNEDGELVPQIGKRATQSLKSLDLAENFHQAMSELYKSNQLPEGKWWPILRNATKDTQDQVQFMNAEQQLQTVITHDRRITDFIEDYNKKLTTINEAYSNAGTDVKPVDRPFDVESIDGLNSAFIVKTLIPWFANKSRMAAADDDVPETLKTALEAHTWVNLAQMGHGAVEDIAKIPQLYRAAIAIREGKEIASEMTSSLRYVSTSIGVLLNIGSIVLDSIELAHAQNEAQKAIFGTQLAFDSAGLVTSAVGIGASIAGATTVAAFAGAGGVILGGLGIGVTALAEAFSGVAMSAQAVGTYFADLDAAYSQGGYRHTTKTMKDGTAYDVMEPIPGAVITTLDLPNRQLIFDSQYIYRTHHNFEGSGNNFRWGMPDIIHDKAKAINIREGIGYPTAKVSFDYDNKTLILPTTPKSYFSYDYNILPFATWRHDRGFDIARRLEEDGRFDFDFYTFPSERVVCKLIPEYMETSIKVILDEQNRDILISQLPQHIKGKLSYQLCGSGGEYRISLQEGVSLSLQSNNSTTSWVLDTRQLDSAEPSIHENLLKVSDVQITLSDCGNISIIGSNGDIFNVDRESKEITLLEVNDRQFTDWQALHEHLKLYSHSDNHNSFVTVDNYQPVGGDNVGRAFYDVSADRFIYTNKPEWSEFLSSAALAKVEGDKAWLYNKNEIWQVEIATGKILKQYLPFNGLDMEFISSGALQHDNQLYMVIEQKMDNNNVTYTYHVEDETLKLVAIDGDTALRTKLENSNERNLSSISVLPTSDQQLAKMLTSFDHQVKATPADMIRISDWWLFFDEHGVKDFVKANAEPKDLVLAFASDHSGYFFYSNQEHSIYFQKDNGLSGTQATKVDIKSIKSIFSHDQKHFALTYEGTLWSLDDQGTAKLVGVTADWLSHHKQNLIKDLGELAHDTTNKFNSLLLLEMQDNNGNSVNAWYDSAADSVIQGGPNLNAEHNLVYLGLDNNEKQAWIFDTDDQAIYRQPLANNKNLVFDEKLILTVLGDSAELFHPEQKYVNVVRDGTNLHIETLGGAILLLPANSDLTEKPTLIAFHVKEREPAQILSDLQELIDEYELPSSVRLLDEPDQEPAWYLTAEKKIIYGNGLEAGHFLHYLGKAVGLESWYIHDQNTGQLWSVSSDQSVVAGNYSFVHLEEGDLILQIDEVTPSSLPQLQEASNLIIFSKLTGQHHYLLNNSLLTHYQQIVIDDQGAVELDLENESTFSLQRSDKDIILHYDSLDTDIIISNIEQAVQRGMVLKVCDTQLPLNQLLTELDSSNNYLQLTISESYPLVDGDGEDSYLPDSDYGSLDSAIMHDCNDLFCA